MILDKFGLKDKVAIVTGSNTGSCLFIIPALFTRTSILPNFSSVSPITAGITSSAERSAITL